MSIKLRISFLIFFTLLGTVTLFYNAKNMLLESSWLFEEFDSIVIVSLGTTIFLVFIVKETYGAILRVLNITDQSK